MWCVRKFVIIFLFLKFYKFHCRKIDDFENLVMENNIKSDQINIWKSNVYINHSTYEIFFHDTAITTEIKYHNNTLVKFYTCMNCEFAVWTRDELFKVVEIFPIVYDSNFVNNIFRDQFSKVVYKLDRIANATDRHIDILFNVTQSIDSSTIDESLLVALLGLRLKIDYIKTLHKRGDEVYDTLSSNGLDREIVQLVLKSINEIEIFSALNCGVTTFYDDKLFERRLMDEQDDNESTRFLRDIEPLNLESTGENRCSMLRMLLGGVLNGENNLSRGMMYVEISSICGGIVLLKDIFDEIRSAHGLEVIYWYQRCIIHIIMSLLCEKIKQFLSSYDVHQVIPSTIRRTFQNINAQLFSGPIGIPVGIIDCFELLASKTQLTSNEMSFVNEQISHYLKDLTDSVNLNKRHYRRNNMNENDEDSLKNLLFSPLEEYLAEIELNIDEYKCFMQLYKLLTREFYSYYAPFVMNYEKIVDFVVSSKFCDWTVDAEFASNWYQRYYVIKHLNVIFTNISYITGVFYEYEIDGKRIIETDITKNPTKSQLINQGCVYIMTLIYFCFDVIKNYNTPTTTAISDSDTFFSAFLELYKIREALAEVVKIYPNHYFQKIAYQLLPYIDILGEKWMNKFTISDSFVRIISLFVNVLNYYGLEYCYPPNHNFIMFNKFYVDKYGGKNVFAEEVETFLLTIKSKKRFEFRLTNVNFVSLTSMFRTYEMSSGKLSRHKNIIRFEWNGKQTGIAEIYMRMVSSLVRSHYFYAFFDILFKFYLATIYREISVFYRACKTVETNVGDSNSFKNVIENILNIVAIPKQFQGIIGRLNEYLTLIYEEIYEKINHENDVRDLEERTHKTFQKIGVYFDTMESARETDKNRNSATRPVYYKEFTNDRIQSKMEGDQFYTKFEKTINEVLRSVVSIKVMLNNIEVYTI